MPVKGLSERRRVPRVGKIHLGVRQKGGYPKQTDYFVVNEDLSTAAWANEAFHEVYGDKPQELDVVFLTDDVDEWADPWYRSYSQSWGLLCKGDGEEAWAMWDEAADGPRPADLESGTWANTNTTAWDRRKIPCHGPECPMHVAKKCKAVMNLQFMLPKVRGIGVWQIDTGSVNSIQNVRSGAIMVKAFLGRIRGVPLKLRLVKKEVVPQDGTKKKTVWVMDIARPDVTPEELLTSAAKLPADRLMLPEPDETEMPEDLFVLEEGSDSVPTIEAAKEEPKETPVHYAPGDPHCQASEPVVVVHGDLPTETVVAVAEAVVAEYVVYDPSGKLAFETLGDFLTSALRELGMKRAEVEEVVGPAALLQTQGERLRAWSKLREKQVG